MPKFFGEIKEASLEQLSADPVANTQGRIYQNTTTGKTMLDDGVNKRALLRNDEKLILGNDPTPANNVRLHKGISGKAQIVPGNNTTLDGVDSTTLAQVGLRTENYTVGTLPTPGNIGRQAWLTDVSALAIDSGIQWNRLPTSSESNDAAPGSNATLSTIASSIVRLTNAGLVSVTMIPAGTTAQPFTLINRTGTTVIILNDAGATPANRILTGTGTDYVLTNNASIEFHYDTTAARWQASISSVSLTAPVTSSIVTKTANYTITGSDSTVLVDGSAGSFNITLPAPATVSGQKFTIKRIDNVIANPVNLIGTISGATDWALYTLEESLTIHCDGTTYTRLEHTAETDWVSAGPVASFYTLIVPGDNFTQGAVYLNNAINFTVARTTNQVGQLWTFALTSNFTAATGQTYTNNGVTFTVVAPGVVSGTSVVMSGNSKPQSSGVLTRTAPVIGASDPSLNFSSVETPLIVSGPASPAVGTLNRVSGTGPNNTNVISFTGNPALIGATTTAPTFFPTPLTNFIKWKRSGKFCTMWINLYQATAGAATGSGDYTWPVVPGTLIDTTHIPIFTGGVVQADVSPTAATAPNFNFDGVGGTGAYNAVARSTMSAMAPYTTSNFRIYGPYQNGGLYAVGSIYMPANQIMAYNFQVTYPVLSWKP